tara:strand:- start:5504 stop:5632 length:129 start_codon:yes stop_codon:yes gene_type:complete
MGKPIDLEKQLKDFYKEVSKKEIIDNFEKDSSRRKKLKDYKK